MRVNVRARQDVALSEADDLPIFSHRLSILNADERNLVTSRGVLRDLEAKRTIDQLIAGLHGPLQHRNAIARAKHYRDFIERFLSQQKSVRPLA